MAPNFAGTNALYSLEFYELIRNRLNPGGVVAQWLPLHLVAPNDASSIAATFQAVFADALLWIDPVDRTGVLLGRMPDPGGATVGADWPGFHRSGGGRDLTEADVRAGIVLDAAGLERYGLLGEVITDDNQLLAYGPGRRHAAVFGADLHRINLEMVARAARGVPVVPAPGN